MCVCTGVYNSCTCTLCENSVRNKNPKSLQVVQAQSVCVRVRVCVCVHVCVCYVCVHMCVHSCTCTLCKDSVRNKNPKLLQAVQAQSVYVCAHVCVCVCVCVCDEYGVRAIYITMQVCSCTCTCFVNTV